MDTQKKDYLSIIRGYSTEASLRSWLENEDRKNTLIINGTSKTPTIQYITEAGRSVDVSGVQSAISVVKTSNLEQELKERDWNIAGRIFAYPPEADYPDLYLSNPEVGFSILPEIQELKDSSVMIYSPNAESDEEELKALGEFNQWYEELINMKTYSKNYRITENGRIEIVSNSAKIESDTDLLSINLGGLYYFNLISCKDFIENSNIVDLLDLGNFSYTSTINLNGLINMSEPGYYMFVAGIEYTINQESYNKEISFSPFDVDIDGKVHSRELIVPVSEYVTSDFRDNCYRVFPTSDKVTECIIGYCYVVFQPINND